MQVVVCEERENYLVKCIGKCVSKEHIVQVLRLGVSTILELSDEGKLAEGCVVILGIYSEAMAKDCVKMIKNLKICRADIKFIVCIADLHCLDVMFEAVPDYMFSLPVNIVNLRKAVDSCFKEYAGCCKSYVTVRKKGKIHCLDASRILFVESRGRCLEITLQQGEKLIIYMQLKEILDKLPDYFWRCHQSYCVNLQKVEAYDCGKLMVEEQKYIPVSKRYRHEVWAMLEKKSIQK